jgi:hypothetical protein
MCGGGNENEVRDRVRMARCVSHRDLAAIRSANTDDPPEPEVLAQRFHVRDVLIESVGGGIAARGAALATMIEVDELHVRGERRECRLETGMISTRAAVNEESHGPLMHRSPLGHQPRPFHVEVDLGITNLRAHADLSCPPQPDTEQTTGQGDGKDETITGGQPTAGSSNCSMKRKAAGRFSSQVGSIWLAGRMKPPSRWLFGRSSMVKDGMPYSP